MQGQLAENWALFLLYGRGQLWLGLLVSIHQVPNALNEFHRLYLLVCEDGHTRAARQPLSIYCCKPSHYNYFRRWSPRLSAQGGDFPSPCSVGCCRMLLWMSISEDEHIWGWAHVALALQGDHHSGQGITIHKPSWSSVQKCMLNIWTPPASRLGSC